MPKPRTFGGMLEAVAADHPTNEAIVAGDRRLTYRELNDRIGTVAKGLLDLGVRKGDRVGVLLNNRPEWFVAAHAATRVGAVAVGLNTWYPGDELAYALERTEVSTLVAVDSFAGNDYLDQLAAVAPGVTDGEPGRLNPAELPFLRNVVVVGETPPWAVGWADLADRGRDVPDEHLENARAAVTPEDPAYILFTSGTTGRPKAVVLEHDGIVTNARGIGARLAVTAADRFFVPIPLFFSLAACNETMTALSHGATLVLQPRFEGAEAARIIDREDCTLLYGTANIVREMEAAAPDLPDRLESLRAALVMGPVSLRERLRSEYGVPLTASGYGLTEVSAICALTHADEDPETLLETNGHPLPNADIRIKDFETDAELPPGERGEIRVRSRGLFAKYYRQPDVTRAALDDEGYLRTGDVGWLDPSGRLVFEGREKDMIKTGGINVSPQQVESVLGEHPEVQAAVVFGVPDEHSEEAVAAVVTTEAGEADVGAIREFCRERLASYKVPRDVHVLEAGTLPRTGTGKVRKEELVERVAGDTAG